MASQEATKSAGEAAANAFKMPDLLRQAVSERFKESPLTGQFGTAAQQFLTAVPQKRTELANLAQTGQAVMSPNQQQSILAGTRAANLVPLISLNDLLQSQFGKSDELVNAGTGAYNAYATNLSNIAAQKRQNYEDVLSQLVAGQNQDFEDRKFQESIRQFNETLGNKNSSGNIPDTPPSTQAGDYKNSEPKPLGTPSRTDIPWRSPRGQWVYDPEGGDWVPDFSSIL